MDRKFLKEAIIEGQKAGEKGEVPVGAVIVKDGEIIARAHNRREEKQDPLSHAELEAISIAAKKLGTWRLDGCELYVTLEPCPMCAGAIINSRIDQVIFGAYDLKSGSAASVQKMFDLPYNYRPELIGGVMEQECADLLSEFFRRLRERGKNYKKIQK